MQSKRWCFTIFCEDNDELEFRFQFNAFASCDWGIYGQCQLERAPSTNKMHVQGFVVFKTNKRLSAVKREFHPTAHWEIMKGSIEQNVAYTSKAETRVINTLPIKWGQIPEVSSNGKRSDLEEVSNYISSIDGTNKCKLRKVAEEYPVQFMKYHRGIETFIKVTEKVTVSTNIVTLRDWQQELYNLLQLDPNDRQIIWMYDYVGNAGKSSFVRYYMKNHPDDCIQLSGRVSDMQYTYCGERVVFFDISRTQADHMDHLYDFAEQLKNGMFHSSKYQGQMKVFNHPHVVFFANCKPELQKWSDDRCILITLSDVPAFTPVTIQGV